MTSDVELPEDVKTVVHANRKIEVIKLLREHRGIGQKTRRPAGCLAAPSRSMAWAI